VKNYPPVSVIIPCHNYENYLGECIKSVRADPYPNVEMCFVHDGCKDPSMFRDRLKTTIFVESHGVSHARNEGLRMSSGKYIWFLDADDMAIPGGIGSRVRYLEENPLCDMVWGKARKLNEARGNSEWTFDMCMENPGKLEIYARWMNAQTLLWRREVFEKFGGYYEALRSKEDKELVYRLGVHYLSPLRKRIVCHSLHSTVAIYRRHAGCKHRLRLADPKWSEKTERIFKRRIEDLKKNGITRENTEFPI
jgi:glycosyltransferase involved in cell wall biosynthesis